MCVQVIREKFSRDQSLNRRNKQSKSVAAALKLLMCVESFSLELSNAEQLKNVPYLVSPVEFHQQ